MMHSKRTVLTALWTMAALLPAMACAAPWDWLHDDADAWQAQNAQDASELQYQVDQAQWGNDNTLYPEAQSSSEGTVETIRDERTKGLLTVKVGNQQITFRDVPLNFWGMPYIRNVIEQGIVSGYRSPEGDVLGIFGPADPVTIEQMAKVLTLITFTDLESCPKVPLNLTASGSWSASYVSCAEQKQWSIYADGASDVHQPATRAQVVASVLQAFKRVPGELGESTFFKDVEPTMQFASYIVQASKDGLVSGYADAEGNPTYMFGPNDLVDRAAFSKIITLATQLYAVQ